MEAKSTLKRICCLLATLSLISCAGSVSRPVSDADRDTSGQYDGTWDVNVQRNATTQYIHNWRMSCRDMSTSLSMVVEDGTATLHANGDSFETHVNEKGQFRFEIPTGGSVRAVNGSDLGDGAVTVIVEGNLGAELPSGRWIDGVKALSSYGCMAKISYSKKA